MVMSEGEILSHFLEDLTVGQSASYERAISEADVREFALMSGDFNPVHLDEAYAQTTRFKGRIVHGMLPVTFVSTVLGTKLPGAGAIFMGASFRFTSAGIASGRVIRACFRALPHSQVRSKGSRPTASAITCCAVFAFCIKLATIMSTVTWSCSGCQQS